MKQSSIFPGKRFGQRIALSFSHKNKSEQLLWSCKCDCGYVSVVEQSRLINGRANCCRTCANTLRRKHTYFEVGDKIKSWLILREDHENNKFVIAQCDCGSIKRINKQSIVYGESKQCGACRGRKAATRHGQNCKGKTTAEYRAWCSAKNRTSNPNLPNYKNYGGRGITMCPQWINSFENFFRDVGPKPSPKHSLERINNDGNYEPSNVRWALPNIQNKNRSVTFKVNDQYINTKILAKELKLHVRTIKNLLLIAKFSIDEVREFSTLTHYQKIEMGKSIKKGSPIPLSKLKTLKSPVLPSPKRHPLWCTWHSMKQRCNNPKNKDYHNYGAKGIEVCEEWSTFNNFLVSILENIGDKPSSEHQLDRIDNSKNYEIKNVRWATKKEQARNKGTSVYLQGIGISAQELSKKYNIYAYAVIKLAKLGWDENGIAFFASLSFKEKNKLKIFARNLSQEEVISAHKRIKQFTHE